MTRSPVGLYIHIPFCRAKCRYCDFNSHPHLEHLHEPYVSALCAEIERFAQRQVRIHADTVYLGGGTPTCLSSDLLTRILATCRKSFQLQPDVEISVEANPGTVTLQNAADLHAAGVNRLSLGAQSFRDDELRLLGRIHSAAQVRDAVKVARLAGLLNINLDLIYGLPRQTLADWRFTLEEALTLEPEHLSLYALSVEESTPLANSIDVGELPAPDPDLAADMYVSAEDRLSQAGYKHYELSNWAAHRRADEGQETSPIIGRNQLSAVCRHSLKYWQRRPYVGFGAGAHSFFGGWRYQNVPQPQDYLAHLEKRQDAVESRQWIGPEEAMAETMILGLRLIDGVRFSHFQREHQRDMRQQYGLELRELQTLGLLTLDAQGVRLTPRGRLLGNQVFVRFWPCSSLGAGPSGQQQGGARPACLSV